MGLFHRRDRRMLDIRQRRNHDSEQHHIRTRDNEMKELKFEPLNYDINFIRDPDTQRVLPVINYWIGERASQTATDDSQALQLRIVHPMGQS